MLIDLSRRPVRLIYEECPSALVIRTMSVRGGAVGRLHREKLYARTKAEAIESVEPQARMSQGDIEYLETVLRDKLPYKQDFVGQFMASMGGRGGHPEAMPVESELTEPYAVVSGYMDQFTKKQSLWRLNLLFGEGPNDRRILTVLDETHSAVLFTVQVPQTVQDIKVKTPLQRYMTTPESGNPGNLWNALLDDDDDEL